MCSTGGTSDCRLVISILASFIEELKPVLRAEGRKFHVLRREGIQKLSKMNAKKFPKCPLHTLESESGLSFEGKLWMKWNDLEVQRSRIQVCFLSE